MCIPSMRLELGEKFDHLFLVQFVTQLSVLKQRMAFKDKETEN